MAIELREVPWQTHHEALLAVREAVFVDELGVTLEEERDGRDAEAVHFLASDDQGRAIGTARLLPSGQIGRIAVLAEHRGAGIGRRLLDASVVKARELGHRRVFLHAQIQTLAFYERAGFVAVSDTFMEAGIAHRAMALDPAGDDPGAPLAFEPEPGLRGLAIENPERGPAPAVAEPGRRRFHGEHDAAERLLATLAQARREIAIFSPELDHALFDRREVIDLLSRFVRSGPASELRILILSNAAILARGHGLIGLMQRLPSRIRLHRLEEARLVDPARSYVIADGRAVWLREEGDGGWADHDDPVRARQLREEFDEAFARGREDPELRELKL